MKKMRYLQRRLAWPLRKDDTQIREESHIFTEPQKWRSHGGLSIGDWEGERGGKGTENK